MDNNSQEALRRVTQNDPLLKKLRIGNITFGDFGDGKFYSDSSDDYSTLGAAIANNTHLKTLEVRSSENIPLVATNREFCNGLKSNSSINNLSLCRNIRNSPQNIAGGIGQEILNVYHENNNQLTVLSIVDANLQNGGNRAIGNTLRTCRNLQIVTLQSCSITDAQLLPIVDAIRGHLQLMELNLHDNNIGNTGCEAITTLLADPNSNLRALYLGSNAIDNEGAIAIANSLRTNNKLQDLFLHDNPIDQSIEDNFCKVLCNTTNINSLYASNHTLNILSFGEHLESLLRLNEDTNKSHVAIKKILKYHPNNIDMEQLFQWDADGEQTLKALPYVIDWFERARVAIADDDEQYGIEERKLSAIFQYARAMPLLFVPPSHIKVDTKKRKRSE